MTVRTLWNWVDHEPRRRGRRPYDAAARLGARKLVSAEWHRQGCSAGWRPIAKALSGRVPVRLVQQSLAAIKLVYRAHAERKRRARSKHLEFTMREVLWSLDAAQMGRDPEGNPISSQVVRDAASRKTAGLRVAARANAEGTVRLLVTLKSVRGSLPLVLSSDNGSENVNALVEAFLEEEKVIHLKNLPHTPEHNARAERAIGELRAEARIESGDVLDPGEASVRLDAARTRLDEKRLRRCLGYRTAQEMDDELPLAYNHVSRASFFAEARRRMANAVRDAKSPRERRLAEREAVLCTMEEYGLLKRTRGDQGSPPAKPEGNS